MSCPRELKTLYREGRVLPFVGAGASMSVSWEGTNGEEKKGPSWSEMVSEATKIMGFQQPDLLRIRGTDLQILEYFKSTHGSMQKLTNWLHHNMQPDNDTLLKSLIHKELFELKMCETIYTTNYDDFIERSFNLNEDNTIAIASEHDISKAYNKRQVVKFHGDFNHPERMVFTESDYEKRVRLEDEMDLKLRSDILGKAVLFIGYSFRDINVSYIFRLLNDKFGNLPASSSGKRAYIIAPKPSNFEISLFEARGIQVISIDPPTPQDHADAVANVLRDLRS